MSKFHSILFTIILFLYSTQIFAFNIEDYDLNQPLTKKIIPTFSHLEDLSYVVNIIKKINNEIKTHPNELKLYIMRNNYTYILWDISPRSRKLAISKKGITYSIATIKKFPESPDGYINKAIFLGVYGITKGVLNALFVSKEMRDALERAYHLDKTYYYAQAPQLLGRLYFKVPPFPMGFGNMEKAKKYLYEAYKIDPNYAHTVMYLAEYEAFQGNKKKALYFLNRITNLNPSTWFEKLMQIWTSRTIDKAKKLLNQTSKVDRYNYDFLTDPLRHKR